MTVLLAGWPGPAAGAAEPYAWSPPVLVNPTTIELANGPTYTRLSERRDYIIRLPDFPKVGRTMIEGGRNVVIVGGHVTIPAGGETDTERRGIYIKNATGIVHIEGVLIDGYEPLGFDAIAISAPRATVQIVNVRVEGVTGTAAGFHGDVVQPFGGVRELRIDHLTGSSEYQGLYLVETSGPIGRAEIRNVNLYHLPNEIDATTYLLWLPVDRSSCLVSYPVLLSNVYINPRPAQDVPGYAVWPNVFQPRGCEAVWSESGAIWPALPSVTGQVQSGVPPAGDFVPEASVGIGYVGATIIQRVVDHEAVAPFSTHRAVTRTRRRARPRASSDGMLPRGRR